MRIVKMARSHKRIALRDKQAAAFVRIGLAIYDDERLVVKDPLPAIVEAVNAHLDQPPEFHLPMEEEKPKRSRRYRRRDMDAEENNCLSSKESDESSSY